MFKARYVLLALLLTACGQPDPQVKTDAPPAIDPFDLSIQVGRYSYMLSQITDLTAERVSEPVNTENQEAREMARSLRETAWRFNAQRSALCAHGIHPEMSCVPAFNPVWLADPADAEVTLEVVNQRADALGEEVMALWGVICDDAKNAVPADERMEVCPME